MENLEKIKLFYTAFQQKDAETMVSFYADKVVFEDPAFGKLIGEDAKNMWRMLCTSGSDSEISYKNIVSTGDTITAHWEANYTFSQTGKTIHNVVEATFKFENGKIVSHRDSFNLKKWATQAMGLKGRILGGTNFFKRKLQAQTNKLLSKYSN